MDSDFIARARAYAARHPENTQHTQLLARLDPTWQPPAPAPAGTAAATPTTRIRSTSTPATAAAPQRPRRPLNLAAVRAQKAAAEAAQRPPAAPPSALRFWASGAWRWAHIAADVPGSRQWERLVRDLVSSCGLHSLSMRMGDPGNARGLTHFRHGEGDAVWAEVTIGQHLHRTDVAPVIRHELAHVADEAVHRELAGSADAWLRSFEDPHRSKTAEAFACAAEEWVTTRTTAEELLEAARHHQDGATA
ncbi:hypothetical protein ACH46L_31675 [Streptomyces althioticus]|uniref:hypothetical protein n=1 Tax=Streptomyces althioticus TaxID=83380 RepID=UPI0037B297EE